MPVHRHKRPGAEHPFVGTWHIIAMELWDDDYVNMERQAFVEISPDNLGSFQFGLVRGNLDGYVETFEAERPRRSAHATDPTATTYAFTWDGFDELDEMSGSGWMRLTGPDEAVGLIKLHLGDRSTFRARRTKVRGAKARGAKARRAR